MGRLDGKFVALDQKTGKVDCGLLYFTTRNANPDNNGSKRPGKNLYAASFVALDVHTGKLRWYYQMIHHDIWDYDAPSPTVLFDVQLHGRTVHAVGEAEKTGWVYLLDRKNGKPLFPMPERPVPQNANQKTYPTQPIPSYTPVVPHAVSDAQYEALVRSVNAAFKPFEGTLPDKQVRDVSTYVVQDITHGSTK